MKKILSIVLAAVLCVSLIPSAFAAGNGSKSREDMTSFEVKAEKMSEGCFIRPVKENEEKEFKDLLKAAKEEIKTLSKSDDFAKYFGEIKEYEEEDGKDVAKAVKYEDLLEDVKPEDRNIYEFMPITAGGFKEGCGDVVTKMLFATPYEKDEDVVVMIGFITEKDGERTIEWFAFDGEGKELKNESTEAKGRVRVELNEETVLRIQKENALLAIISD